MLNFCNGIGFVTCPQIPGSSVTINCLRPTDYFTLEVFRSLGCVPSSSSYLLPSTLSSGLEHTVPLSLFVLIPLTFQLQAGIWERKIFLESSLAKKEAQG